MDQERTINVELVKLACNLLRAVRAFLQQFVADGVNQAVLRDLQERRKLVSVELAGLAVGLVEDVILLDAKCAGVAGGG